MPPKKPVSGAAANQGKNEKKKTLSEKLEELEKENESLKNQVAQFKANFDYTKIGRSEDYLTTILQDEIAKLKARINELKSSQSRSSSAAETVTKKKSDETEKLQKDKDQKDKDRQDMQSKEKSPCLEIDNLKQQPHERDMKLKQQNEELQTMKTKNEDNNTKINRECNDKGIKRTTKEEELHEENNRLKKIETLQEELQKTKNELDQKKAMIAETDSKLHTLEQKLEATETEKHNNKKSLDDLKIELQTAQSEIEKLKSQQENQRDVNNVQNHDHNTNLKTDISSRDVEQTPKEESDKTTGGNEREIETLQEELQTTKNELDEKKAMIAETDSKLHTLEQKLKATETEKQDNKKSLDDLKIELQTAQREIEKLKSQQENQRDVNNIQNHDHTLRDEHEIAENKKEIAKLKNDLSAAESKVKDLEKQMKSNETKYSDQMTEQRKKLENELKQKEKEINELKMSLRKSESEVKSLEDKISKLESTRARSASRPRNDELKKAHEEIEELKTRLSKVMGDKITENNPDIADLSDLNRPTKLAERYSELYDNEWTDAFEELEDYGMKSRQILDKLYNILKDVYIFSQKVSYDYEKSVRSSAIRIPGGSEEKPKTPNLNSSTRKQLVDLKKTFAPLLASDVLKLYLKQCKEAIGPKTEKFISVCTEICWLMSVQDPPVVLDLENPKGKFDKDKYKFYQTSGKQVDFVVWAPMKLHENGPLLGKGVAEGK